MFNAAPIQAASKSELYDELAEQARGLLHGERDRIANAANFAALVYHALPDMNWAGFYFYDGVELVVGPFQGKPACVRIALGKGVCGTAATTRQTQVVADVDAFPVHIPCDSASRSEVVVPLDDGRVHLGPEEPVARLAVGLGRVHGHVGVAQQLGRGTLRALRDSDPDRRRDRDLATRDEDRLGERGDDPLGGAHDVVAAAHRLD